MKRPEAAEELRHNKKQATRRERANDRRHKLGNPAFPRKDLPRRRRNATSKSSLITVTIKY
jgi:hypothetical protein